ncbi:MAG: hypothetical protein ACP5K5_02990 [Candidatus Micrarchaeia archaeon]
MGDKIKIYRSNGKLVLNIPFEVISTLDLHDGDEVDFFKYSGKSFIFAKKDYIASLLTKISSVGEASQNANVEIDKNELTILKKLDTLRYSERTTSMVNNMLSNEEKNTLQKLIRKKIVVPFKKEGENEYKYSIAKWAYDRFLFGKREQKAGKKEELAEKPKAWEEKIVDSDYTNLLESKGYLVLSNEADAAAVSAALEESIKQGLVVGTRAFNKKFYVALRGFINKYAPKITKLIEQKPMRASEIAEKIGIDEDGVRSILYYMAELGDVTEVRRDIFKAA